MEHQKYFDQILKISNEIIRTIKNKKKIIFCGNGGSAADSQHLCAELVSKFLKNRQPFSSISLTTNTSTITSISNDFSFDNKGLSFLLLLAGPMTVIPLFLYVRGVELIGLGPTGMIFYITPTLQFILGYFYYNEDFSLVKFLSFIIIWIAVIIYLKDLYETN